MNNNEACGDCVFYLKRGDCPRAEYKDYERNKIACLPTDAACEKFKLKGRKGRARSEGSGKKKTWNLKLDAKTPEFLKPCGFYDNKIIESAWLPYEESESGEITVRPSLVIKNKNGNVEIKDFLEQNEVKGDFPSQNLKTLMSPIAANAILKNETIDAQAIDAEIDRAFDRHTELSRACKIVMKRWIEATYFYDVFSSYPILNIIGVSESGKSRLLLIVLALSYHAEGVVDPSEAALFRSKEEDKVVMCIDEAEYLNSKEMNQILRTLINASYSKGLGVPRYDEIDGKRIKRMFELYGPICIVGISGLEGVTASRSIRVISQRANRDFPKARQEEYSDLRDKLYILRFQLAFKIKEIYDTLDISDIVTARFLELFLPLFVMTKVFGNEEEFDLLSKWAKEYENVFRAENFNIADEEQILIALSNVKPIKDDWHSLKLFVDNVNMGSTRRFWPQKVSQILSRIGITERRKVHGCTEFRVTRENLELIAKRLGIDISNNQNTESIRKSIDLFYRMKHSCLPFSAPYTPSSTKSTKKRLMNNV